MDVDEETGPGEPRTNGEGPAAGRGGPLARLGCLGWWTVLVAGLAVLDVAWIATQAPPDPRCFDWCDLGPIVGRAVLVFLAIVWVVGLALGIVVQALGRRCRG